MDNTKATRVISTSNENWNSKVHTIKILLDCGAIASIIRKDMLYERHKTLKEKKNQWSTMAGTFNTTFVTEIISKLTTGFALSVS